MAETKRAGPARPSGLRPACLRRTWRQGHVSSSLARGPQEQELDQESRGCGCGGLLKFHFRANEKLNCLPLFTVEN